tara:strand:+ start:458 stop:838 length:381 start_codon:yes stop_codon:yes gene_type:complete
MFQRKPRRFRHRSNGRGRLSHIGDKNKGRLRNNHFSNGHIRNNFKQTLSAEKLFEKYNNMAKEAMSSGDKTLCENFLQHADHYMRIIEDKNKNQDNSKPVAENQSKTEDTSKPDIVENNLINLEKK